MEYFVGVDVGSATAKVVVIDATGEIAGYSILPTGASGNKTATECLNRISKSLPLDINNGLKHVVATGYGRERVSFATETISEISCHAQGASRLFPTVRTVIDIGGQDSKVIAVGENGWPTNFAMNDKCAAGTGRFLEVMSRVLELDLERMSQLSLESQAPAQVSSMCTVFAESEVISLISEGRQLKDVVAGIHQSIVRRIMGMVNQVGLHKPVVMSGGVAKNAALVHMLGEKLDTKILVPPEPQIVGALGAALLSRESIEAKTTEV